MVKSKNKSKEETANNFFTTEFTTEETVSEVTKLEDDDVKQAAPEVLAEPSIELMPTLPENFKSLVGRRIDVTSENRNAQNIITLLGNALGVDDYETNVASFWFLDFIALQVLRFESALDGHGMSVMVSWLAGEMKLIRDNSSPHAVFLRYIQDIFVKCYEKNSLGQPLLHWDLLAEESTREEALVPEEIAQEPKEPEVLNPKITKHRVGSKSHQRRIPSKDFSKHSVKSSERTRIGDFRLEVISSEENITRPEVHSNEILDIVVEATYSMYGNSFHYALIVAAFVEPVQLHEYNLPFKFRVPRPLKMFDIEIKRPRGQDSVPSQKSKETKKKKTAGDKKPKKSLDNETIEITRQTVEPVDLNEEEILMKKREFILPLMEANEASSVLEAYKKMQTE